MEILYIGPNCPRCKGNEYIKVQIGAGFWKRCTECGRLSPISDGELTEKEPE